MKSNMYMINCNTKQFWCRLKGNKNNYEIRI